MGTVEHGPRRLRCPRPAPATQTVGVEEEFALLDAETGAVVPCAVGVIADCQDPEAVVAESTRFLVETRTPVCHTLDDLGASIRASRRAVAAAARQRRAVAVASGVPPYGIPREPLLTDDPRYRELARRFPWPMQVTGVCGCHVHVGIPSRRAGVDALLRLRPWLPALIAISANSPIWNGFESGWASRRLPLVSRWPTAVPAPPLTSVEQYDEQVGRAVALGDALDARSVYYLARLSPRHPTIEVRVADVALTAEDAVGYASLVRAVVGTALDDAARGAPAVPVSDAVLRRACRSAARGGLVGVVQDPLTGDAVPAWALVEALFAHVADRLRSVGDEEQAVAHLDRLRARGGGADRQLRLFRASGAPRDFVASLEEATLSDPAG